MSTTSAISSFSTSALNGLITDTLTTPTLHTSTAAVDLTTAAADLTTPAVDLTTAAVDFTTAAVDMTTAAVGMTTTTVSISNATTVADQVVGTEVVSWDDATWILTSSFIIFTMQSGFGLLEAGSVGAKNEVNIMIKNAVDVVFGGITYWAFGYGFSFGMDPGSNPFIGWGYFCVDSTSYTQMGSLFSSFVFQLSFATTATTIVSGAMAERTKLTSYIVFSLLNTVVYCIPVHWMWAENGFLKVLGVLDFAGSGVVHMLGAVSALVAAMMLGPRLGRYDNGYTAPAAGNAANALLGMFMLWWGWLAFNCGSTYGISGGKWILASKSAVTTLNASMAGGLVGIIFTYIYRKKVFIIADIVNSILGALVAITASCAMVHPWEAFIIGAVGGLLCVLTPIGIDRLKVDDPVGAVAVHGAGGLWGMLAVGLFVEKDPLEDITAGRSGLFHGGGFYLLGVQLLACIAIAVWSGAVSFIILFCVDKGLGLRMSLEEELLGADAVEHGIVGDNQSNAQPLRPDTSRSHSMFAFGGKRSRPSSSSMSHHGNRITAMATAPQDATLVPGAVPTTVTDGDTDIDQIITVHT